MNWLLLILVCVAVGAVVLAASFFTSLRGILAKCLEWAGVGESRQNWARGVAGVVMLAGALAWWQGWQGADKEPAAGLMVASDAARVDDAGAEKIPDSMTCPCGSPAVCVGPKGGRYCVTIEGKKRYK